MSKRLLDMTAAKLNQPIVFENYTETYDDLGQPVKTWGTFLSAWGNIIHLRGDERWLAAQAQAEGTITLEVRFIPALETALRADIKLLRVRMGARIFEIKAFRDPDERRTRLHLDVKEIL